ncbi:hypothetical protein BKA69DRAFT_1067335 [Paraphysoderma sedebokerense]|nr:hypothetical protein BKA69DRAFT_1067314 [Paraphysoderma sedebokerense]KAI9142618.1 hypothetical protein BKA69DRAFT_1067335 [Paraphysoderma sedebokerense]
MLYRILFHKTTLLSLGSLHLGINRTLIHPQLDTTQPLLRSDIVLHNCLVLDLCPTPTWAVRCFYFIVLCILCILFFNLLHHPDTSPIRFPSLSSQPVLRIKSRLYKLKEFSKVLRHLFVKSLEGFLRSVAIIGDTDDILFDPASVLSGVFVTYNDSMKNSNLEFQLRARSRNSHRVGDYNSVRSLATLVTHELAYQVEKNGQKCAIVMSMNEYCNNTVSFGWDVKSNSKSLNSLALSSNVRALVETLGGRVSIFSRSTDDFEPSTSMTFLIHLDLPRYTSSSSTSM